jgi:hypothetical protein
MNEKEIRMYLNRLVADTNIEPPALALAIHLLVDTEYGTKPSNASTRTVICSWLNMSTVPATRYVNQLVHGLYIKIVRNARNFPTISINIKGK